MKKPRPSWGFAGKEGWWGGKGAWDCEGEGTTAFLAEGRKVFWGLFS